MSKHLARALKLARRSSIRKHKIGCVLTKGDRVVAEGVNHTSQVNLKQYYSIHAEIAALWRASKRDLEGSTAHIACLSKGRNIRLAKPCLACAIALNKAGIRRVEYTINDSTYAICDLDKELASSQAFYVAANSTGYRKVDAV